MIRSTALLLILALAACALPPGTDRVPLSSTGMIAQANTLISVQRAGTGIIRPLVHSPALQAAAQAHADDLQVTGGIGHVGSDGSTLSDRINRSSYTACFAAENVARGQPDTRSAVASWANSPGHRANMVNANATQFGFANAGDVWVLVLARSC
ncbi:CAP domain-containing protein [Rhodophyticola sp. CCM32]|uniref:CAP domain-containing protein n=1 Tax=Rhodophyticola sp. CCM32 TaxID=2916397 RepID=UPI00107F6F89|nr:CAP domain-containing protein [Rhodophyticola sp. CCM32]QBY01620.1 CAP domain-containing protein [Rhodophyticola sp. CCM32]